MTYSVYHGDCREGMALLPANSQDSIITDPPYGIHFMGRGWDRGVPGVEFWQAALRVAKPGAFLLAFGGTRMFHRLTCAIEDAGWEIRDCMMWLYGSGFPKNTDISKEIDKKNGDQRKIIGVKPGHEGFVGRDSETCVTRDTGSQPGFDRPWMHDAEKRALYHMKTAPGSAQSTRWDGWGTALKPAWEPIIVAMKPLVGTFAENALQHGVAGINVAGCRVEGGVPPVKWITPRGHGWSGFSDHGVSQLVKSDVGRFPANVILDEEAGVLLDQQTGILKAGGDCSGDEPSTPAKHTYGEYKRQAWVSHGDSGGASRYFYCAKAAKSEKGDFNTWPTVKPLALMRYLCRLTKTPTGGGVLDPFMGSGSTGVAAIQEGRDFHGMDSDLEAVGISKRRLREALIQPVDNAGDRV